MHCHLFLRQAIEFGQRKGLPVCLWKIVNEGLEASRKFCYGVAFMLRRSQSFG